LYVVNGVLCFQADSFTDHKGYGLGFRPTNALGRFRTAAVLVKKRMRRFVCGRREFLGDRLAG